MSRVTSRRRVVRYDSARGVFAGRHDTLTGEEPLEIRVDGRPLSVTMRTPGHDVELATGFLLTEGVVTDAAQVLTARYCAGAADDGNTYNVLDVTRSPDAPAYDASVERNFYTTSSCGVCGKASIDAVRVRSPWPAADDDVTVTSEVVASLPGRLRAAQDVFERTGGLHAAGLFQPDGELLAVREDVGRHNAVDKLVGWAAQAGLLPLRGLVLQLSGRVSFELVQKAVMAGVPVVTAVSAPSSLAVDLAEEAGVTVVGFIRADGFNVYTHAERIVARSRDGTRSH